MAERRLVSVLFADLVGFTRLAEHRDAEEVRELLTRYFDSARTVIARHGGTVEKFIGDAVMAVWGAPTAQENDAERAVRAALDLVAAVATLGADVGSGDLRVRAGVVTGEAAITLGAEGQGMVAGDVVNTASRVQSVAPPGAVFVDDATRRLTETPIAYEDAGLRELKGKAEPVHLWQAMRVVAMVGGLWRAGELEAPFVGRDRELRLVKDLFHATIEEGRARLVSVTGLAGIGKTRLAWEFEKYMDGLSEAIWWHRGRCLAYGEGVTYWALAEMVRRRAEILEAEAPDIAHNKLRAALERYIPDAEERRWLEPRLVHLLGLEERAAQDRVDLFAAWRLFFERLADQGPAVLLFEEFQWADAGLVDFIEYLVEWSRHYPLFIITLARPELTDRHPSWGSGKRSFHSLYLEPLPREAMDELLSGLVPGLSADLRHRIRDRAEGVPLYAVETVRMLLDRGLLRREGNQYAVAGAVGDLDVPDSLHALIAARLDALPTGERAVLQNAAVLGQSFTRERLGALTGLDDAELGLLLDQLVRKEFLTVQTDPRSPERGQYAFLQALVLRVAYETLSRRDRKARHLEAARQLEATWAKDADDVVEVVAAHYLEAHRAAPDDPDAPEIAESARRMLVRAGQRATGLGSSGDAERYYLQASVLTADPVERAELLELAGEMARRAGRSEAREHFESAIELFESTGHAHPAARVSARLGQYLYLETGLDEGLTRLELAFKALEADEPDRDLGQLAHELGRAYALRGRHQDAAPLLELAIDIAEAEGLHELLADALITKSFVLSWRGRRAEPMALQQHALTIALEHDAPMAALRANYNLADLLSRDDRYETAIERALSGATLARRLGDRPWEARALANLAFPLYVLGRWDEALTQCEEMTDAALAGSLGYMYGHLAMILPIHAQRGELATVRSLTALAVEGSASTDPQESSAVAMGKALVFALEGRHAEAVREGERAFAYVSELGPADAVREGFNVAVESAFAGGDIGKAAELLRQCDSLPRINATRYQSAHAMRFRARLAASQGDDDAVGPTFEAAERLFADIDAVFARAVTSLECAEWLVGAGRHADAMWRLDEAAAVFQRLRARPWVDRAARVRERAKLIGAESVADVRVGTPAG